MQGVAVNPTVTTADLLVFVHGAMDSGLAAEEAARAAAAAAVEAAGQAPANGAALPTFIISPLVKGIPRTRALPVSRTLVLYIRSPAEDEQSSTGAGKTDATHDKSRSSNTVNSVTVNLVLTWRQPLFLRLSTLSSTAGPVAICHLCLHTPLPSSLDMILFKHQGVELIMMLPDYFPWQATGSAGDIHDGSTARHQHLMVEAALRLLLRALRKGNAASDRSPANLGMLDGLLPVLGRALRSRHAAVTERSLRCLALLAPLPLPGQHPFILLKVVQYYWVRHTSPLHLA